MQPTSLTPAQTIATSRPRTTAIVRIRPATMRAAMTVGGPMPVLRIGVKARDLLTRPVRPRPAAVVACAQDYVPSPKRLPQPSPSSVRPRGLYSQPTQPA